MSSRAGTLPSQEDQKLKTTPHHLEDPSSFTFSQDADGAYLSPTIMSSPHLKLNPPNPAFVKLNELHRKLPSSSAEGILHVDLDKGSFDALSHNAYLNMRSRFLKAGDFLAETLQAIAPRCSSCRESEFDYPLGVSR